MKELVLKENSIDKFLKECCIGYDGQSQGMIIGVAHKYYVIKDRCDLTTIEKVIFKRDEITNKTGSELQTEQIFLVKEYDDYCWELVLDK